MERSIHIQPRIQVLSEEAIERIHTASLQILGKLGYGLIQRRR